jgi:hypothetical protein
MASKKCDGRLIKKSNTSAPRKNDETRQRKSIGRPPLVQSESNQGRYDEVRLAGTVEGRQSAQQQQRIQPKDDDKKV